MNAETMKPILFNTEMVQAILDSRKTVTRRTVKYKGYDGKIHHIPAHSRYYGKYIGKFVWETATDMFSLKPTYQPGDILYVRETFFERKGKYYYKADGKHLALNDAIGGKEFFKWHPSTHMPKEAARIFLRVTDVRVERLQDITSDGVKAEGVMGRFGATRGAFKMLWDSTIKPADIAIYGWAANPFVWVINFDRIS